MARLAFVGVVAFALAAEAMASPATEDVPVPGGIAALARALDVDVPDRGRCLSEVVRIVYNDAEHGRKRDGSAYQRLMIYFAARKTERAASGSADLVPVPMSAALWSAIFGKPVSAQSLFEAILSDAKAAHLAYGLSALDDETLTFFAEHPKLLTTLYREHAVAFAAFAGHLRVHNGRVVTPGGRDAEPQWEAVVHARTSDPSAFITSLYASARGRVAYLYDVIGHLDRPRQAFALGLSVPAATRVARFAALSHVTASTVREWDATFNAFSRPVSDLLSLLLRVQVDELGTPRPPAAQRLWAAVLQGEHVDSFHLSDREPSFDAAWLAEAVLPGEGPRRQERLDQFAFGQRAFDRVQGANGSDLFAAIAAYVRAPMLMLAIEQIGIRTPSTYAALARRAESIRGLDPAPAAAALAQFQGGVAIVARMALAQTVDRTVAEHLLQRLALLDVDARRGYEGGIAAWLMRDLRPALSAADLETWDSAIARALGGAPADATQLSWEGQSYVFELASAEVTKLGRIRQRQRAASLQAAMTLHVASVALASDAFPGAAAVARSLRPMVDAALADALVALSYAMHSSYSPGFERLDREASRRHDFGLTSVSRGVRERAAWALPRLVFTPGEPWHVEGALLGLDAAIAPLGLRRISSAPPVQEPRLLSTNRFSFLTTLGLINPFALRHVDANAIASAVRRGEQRVSALTAASPDLATIIEDVRLDGWRARALQWSLRHSPQDVPTLFSTTELLYLGGGKDLDVRALGMSALAALGCLCTMLPPPGLQTALIGRAQLGMLPFTLPDLQLRVAVLLSDLQLPVTLAEAVLEAALYDLARTVRPAYADDWLTLVRGARALSREQVEDYFAAVTAMGPLAPTVTTRRVQ